MPQIVCIVGLPALGCLPGKHSLSLCCLYQPLHVDNATKWVKIYLVQHETSQMSRQILQSEGQLAI